MGFNCIDILVLGIKKCNEITLKCYVEIDGHGGTMHDLPATDTVVV